MPADFRDIKKHCLNCGKRLILRNTRDIKRKKYCSKKCTAEHLWEIGVFKGLPITEESKHKMREAKLNLIRNGWKPIGWKKYLNIKPFSVGKYKYKGTSEGLKRMHTIIAEGFLSRKLQSDEVVHHIDGNKANNDPSNLFIMTKTVHSKLHSELRRRQFQNSLQNV